MLKSLILLLLSVMIFTSCGDNGVEVEDNPITFYSSDNAYIPIYTPDGGPKLEHLIKKIKNKNINIKLIDINKKEYNSINIYEYNTFYKNTLLNYKIEPIILTTTNGEYLHINITTTYENQTYNMVNFDNEIFDPLKYNISKIILY